MTGDYPHEIVPPAPLQGREYSDGKVRFRSICCIFDNPLLLHRLCKHLEQGGETFVEISYSVEDALHLMTYVTFDLVITDCTCWQDELNGLLKALRSRHLAVPVIYFTRDRDAALEAAGEEYEGVYYLAWGVSSAVPEFGELSRLIDRIVPLA